MNVSIHLTVACFARLGTAHPSWRVHADSVVAFGDLQLLHAALGPATTGFFFHLAFTESGHRSEPHRRPCDVCRIKGAAHVIKQHLESHRHCLRCEVQDLNWAFSSRQSRSVASRQNLETLAGTARERVYPFEARMLRRFSTEFLEAHFGEPLLTMLCR